MCSLTAMACAPIPDYQTKWDSTEERRKCGDISLKLSTTSLTLHCIFCDFYIDTLEQFLNHLKNQHFDVLAVETTLWPEVEIKEEVLELTDRKIHEDIGNGHDNAAADPLLTVEEQNNIGSINIKSELNDSQTSDEESHDEELKKQHKTCDTASKPKSLHICRLIHYIHEHPILWNTQLSDHYICSKRMAAIESICTQFLEEFPNLSIDFKYVRTKFAELKNIYFNYIKNKTKPKKNSAKYYELLHFLKDHEKNKKNRNRCAVCKKDVVYLGHHMKKYHAGNNAPQKCDVCEEILPSARKLQNHIRVFHRCYQCDHCSHLPFTNAKSLRKHIESKHPEVELPRKHSVPGPGPKERICEQCGLLFKSQIHLREHIRRVHLQLRPYVCRNCPRSFKDYEKLRAHSNSVHLNYREFACDVCTKAFFSRKTLVQHKQLHSDVKNYECRVCGKAFRQAPALHSHMKTHS